MRSKVAVILPILAVLLLLPLPASAAGPSSDLPGVVDALVAGATVGSGGTAAKQANPVSNRTCLNQITCNGNSCASALDCVGKKVGSSCGGNKTCNSVCQNSLSACCGCSRSVAATVDVFDVSVDAGNVLIELEASGLTSGTELNVYRSGDLGAPLARINEVPFTAGATVKPTNASFRFADEPGDGDFTYTIEIVDGGDTAYSGAQTVTVFTPSSKTSLETFALSAQATPISNRTCLNQITCTGGTSCGSALSCVGLKVGASCGGNNTCNSVCQNSLAACCGCSRATSFDVSDRRVAFDGNEVAISWSTLAEHATGSFNLYRSVDGGAMVRVNEKPISATGDAQKGGVYEFRDDASAGVAVYFVEVIDPDAGKILVGPLQP